MSGMLCPMAGLYGHSFSMYTEPDTWRGKYNQLEQEYLATRKPVRQCIEFTEPPKPFPYTTFRNQIVEEELEYNRVYCPIVSLDGSVDYSMKAEDVKQAVAASNSLNAPVTSLFTIRSEDDTTGVLEIDTDDDYDDYM
jgi:hypothetical protein